MSKTIEMGEFMRNNEKLTSAVLKLFETDEIKKILDDAYTETEKFIWDNWLNEILTDKEEKHADLVKEMRSILNNIFYDEYVNDVFMNFISLYYYPTNTLGEKTLKEQVTKDLTKDIIIRKKEVFDVVKEIAEVCTSFWSVRYFTFRNFMEKANSHLSHNQKNNE